MFLSLVCLRSGSAVPTVSPTESGVVAWVWSGAVTPTSAVIKAKILEPSASVRLLVTDDPSFAAFRSVPSSGFDRPDEAGIATFVVRQLQPDTLYHYAVEVKGRRSRAGRFRTFSDGPMSFSIAFASCAATGSRHRIFSTIRRLDPLFFLHMGDFHYEDITINDPTAYRRAYDLVLASDTQSELYRNTPIVYVWDDHDFGPNDADRTAPGKPAALQTYRQVVPHYPLVDSEGEEATINQAFTVGRVRFLVTDGRSERTPATEPDGPGKTMLGERQRDWLFRELSAAEKRFPLVVWVNEVPWITRSAPGTVHGWEPYGRERSLIADRIKALGLTDRLIMLSGDAHMVAIDDGSNSNYASDRKPGETAFPVIQAAPLDRPPSIKGGPYSHGVHADKRLFGLLSIQQFGLLKVTDDGTTLKVEISGRDADGNLLKGMLLNLLCRADGCRVTLQ